MGDTLNTGVHLVGDTLDSGAHLVGDGLRSGAHFVQAGVDEVGRTISGASVDSRVSQRPFEKDNEMQIFCSDLYTVEFIKEEITRCKQNIRVDNLLFEDLIVRDDEAVLKAARKLVRATSMAPPEPDSDDDTEDELEFMPRGFERLWKRVVFCDCITNAEEYVKYQEKKRNFQAALRQTLKKKGITKFPIKFESRIEIHPLTDMQEVVELLDKIEADKTIIECKFPYMCNDIRRLPKELAKRFDRETLEVKQDQDPVEIYIRYSSKPVKKGKRPTLLVKQCSSKLINMSTASRASSSNLDSDFCMSDGELSCPDLDFKF